MVEAQATLFAEELPPGVRPSPDNLRFGAGLPAAEEYVPVSTIVDRVMSSPRPSPQARPAAAEVCARCGCTEGRPCRLADGDECTLRRVGRRFVCNGPECLKKESRR